MAVNRTELPRLAGLVLLAASVSFASSSADAPTSKTAAKTQPVHHTTHHRKPHKTRVRGQKAIDENRAREIQQALIREHYLKGEPSGKWDATTQQAMRHYQEDQGWQAKTVPDSRALIRLGLGPDHEHLLNPESAMTTEPAKHSSNSAATATQTAPARESLGTGSAEVSAPSSEITGPPTR
jgi:peptidoglycan hydrolase-like protein with peptidoglycan-binding domain